MAIPAIVWQDQDFHFPSERETGFAGFLGTAPGAARGGATREPRAGDPWGAGSGLARVSRGEPWVALCQAAGRNAKARARIGPKSHAFTSLSLGLCFVAPFPSQPKV